MSHDLRLRVNGLEYGGWERVSLTRSISAVSGAFDLGVSDRWAGQSKPWPIRKEDACEIRIDGEPVISGYVEESSPSYDAESHTLDVSGKDKTASMVECSARPATYTNVTLLTLAKKLAAPFGIDVWIPPGNPLPPLVSKLTVDPGDSAFDALERACRMVGYLPISDGTGGLALTRAGSGRCATDLVEGQNIKAASGRYSAESVYRTYRVLAQQAGRDELNGGESASVVGEATDATVKRAERLLIVRAEGGMTREQAKRRAQWEATVRAARADTVEVTVQGWTQGDGNLWPINAIVHVKSPFIEVDANVLIVAATYSLSESGSETRLSLARPGSFLPEPTIQKGSGVGIWADLARGV